jgi:hypothetical protein
MFNYEEIPGWLPLFFACAIVFIAFSALPGIVNFLVPFV